MDYITPITIATHHITKNATKDVLSYSCTGSYFSSIACTRNGLMSMFVILLSFLFIGRIFSLYKNHSRYYHQICVFVLAIVECFVITVHWLYIHTIQVEATVQYLMVMQMLIICHFYLSRVTRLIGKTYFKVIIISVLAFFFVYFTAVSVVIIVSASIKSITTCTSCFDPYWLMLSLMEMTLIQVFLVCGVYITKKMNDVVTMDSARRSHKLELWSIVIAFELSSVASVVYNAVMFSYYDPKSVTVCSQVFDEDEWKYSAVYVVLMIFEVFIPLITLLLVFHPVDRNNEEEGPLLATSNFHNYPTFSPERNHHRIGRRASDVQRHLGGSIQVPPSNQSGPYRKTQSYPVLPVIHEEGII